MFVLNSVFFANHIDDLLRSAHSAMIGITLSLILLTYLYAVLKSDDIERFLNDLDAFVIESMLKLYLFNWFHFICTYKACGAS